MSDAATLLHDADANQARASDPAASAWVSASAGTGKTAVLVKRCLRLLLAGARPESILCLTYTKTAAAEMQNRLLKELAAWATDPAAELEGKLAALMRVPPREENLRRARRLFAHALDARGGLKIHTIHGFCERLLQRFPLESGVSPHFAVMDERDQAEMRRAAFDSVVALAAGDPGSRLGHALAKIIGVTSEDYFRKVVDAVLGKRAELSKLTALHDGDPDWPEAERVALRKSFAFTGDDSEETLTAAMAVVLTDDDIDNVVAALERSGAGKADRELRDRLQAARLVSGPARAEILKPIFLTEKDAPRAKTCSSGMQRLEPAAWARLDEAGRDFAHLYARRAELVCVEVSSAVLAIADRVQGEYERAKRAEAVLDYDDLIVKVRALFDRGAAAWVLFKIDGGIDHILVDEAQDTNPEQWAIIERLADEFFAGEGASDAIRTLFAVGDEKQSIYSFQGADPARFGATGRAFRAKARAAGLDWNDVPLNLSFRSTEPILTAVDLVFANPPAANGVVWGDGVPVTHFAHRQGEAGLLELWDVQVETGSPETDAFEPWSESPEGAGAVDALCGRIAGLIKRWLRDGELLPAAGRPIRAGDVLILVRRRDPFTAPMFRALKREGVSVAGADRMRLMDQLAVQDLVALADVLLMREDDLSLAVVLKSPLFGLDDDALFDLAYLRERSLWSTLMEKSERDPRFAEAAEYLSAWLSRADLQPPFEFFFELLEQDGQRMRKRMLSRLGPEAAEAIDELLDLALAYDREAAPSLQGFIDWLRVNDVEIKRDMDQDRDEVRIMTVHGAKGLEAPIVFLPDTCMTPKVQGPRILSLPRAGAPGTVPHLMWPPTGHSGLSAFEDAKTVGERADREEYHRLLYVGMTRAADRLYICGWQGARKRPDHTWYDLIADALEVRLDKGTGEDGRPVRRLESEQGTAVKPEAARAAAGKTPEMPPWATAPAPPERPRELLAPSRLEPYAAGAPGRVGEQPPLGPQALAENKRFARGRLVHTLLQYLPEVAPAERMRAAESFVAVRGSGLAEEMRSEIVSETLAIVQDSRFAPLFAPGSLGEVPVVARIGDGENARDLSGQIDRLAIVDDALLILDYKTNRPPPREPGEVAQAYIVQLAAYRLSLRAMFPGRSLRAAIVWTDGPKLMEIPSTLLDDAERRILDAGRSLDVVGVRT